MFYFLIQFAQGFPYRSHVMVAAGYRAPVTEQPQALNLGSMNHVAFNVPADKMEEYRDKLQAKGVKTTQVLNHDDSRLQVSKEMHQGVFVRSLYFQDHPP